MQTTQEFLLQLRNLDIRITLDHGRVNCSAPKGALTSELRAELVQRKPEIIALLNASESEKPASVEVFPISRSEPISISHGQERLWFLNEYGRDNTAYTIAGMFRLSGELDANLLEACFRNVVERHEILRTSYCNVDGNPVANIQDIVACSLKRFDLQAMPIEQRESRALEQARRIVQEPFDLGSPPMLRASLLQTAENEYYLILCVHHIAADGWSIAIILDEAVTAYRNTVLTGSASLPEITNQFFDYAAWHRNLLNSGSAEKQLSWWRRQLSGKLPILELPGDYPRPAMMTFRGSRIRHKVPDELAAQLKTFANSSRATLFMVMMTGFKILLHRYTGQTDVIVGSATAGRNHPCAERMVGLFINTLALRTSLEDDPTVNELLNRVRETTLSTFAYSDVPFDQLVASLKPERDLNHSPIFQVMFTLQNFPFQELKVPGVKIEIVEFDAGTARYDLTVEAFDLNGELQFDFEYNADLFEEKTVRRMQQHFVRLLEEMIENADQTISSIPMLIPEERQQILAASLPNPQEYPSHLCIHDLIEAQVERTPERIAVSSGGQSLTYAQLQEQSNALAERLRSLGVKPGVLVAVCLDRSTRMPVALCGVLKAGGTYVPLDPQYPVERLAYMLEDSKAAVLITETDLVSSLPFENITILCMDRDVQNLAVSEAPTRATPSDIAYVIYTSGSTGKPKGVQISHRAAVNFLCSMQKEPGICADDRLLAVTTLCFDIAGLEMYLPLIAGAEIVVAPRTIVADARKLAGLLADSRATILQATPATWRMLFEAGWEGTPGLKVLCGGEAMPRDLATRLLNTGCEIWNLYGPTETTIWSTAYRVKHESGTVPIGWPIANTSIYLLDKYGQPVPRGVAGELYIGGDGVAAGYLNRPELTSEKFLANPFVPGERIYRTGDLARYRPDGILEFFGRADHQVKIRGFRIEPGEIEVAIAKQPGIRQALVVTHESEGDVRLVAYAACNGSERPSIEHLKSSLGRVLPEYMVPSAFVLMDSLPLTPNGKVDRNALPKPDFRAGSDATYAPPRNSLERDVAGIWQELLKVERVGIKDNFFDLGGHSLLVVQLQSRLRQRFGCELTLVDLFQKPTVALIAKHLDSGATTLSVGGRA